MSMELYVILPKQKMPSSSEINERAKSIDVPIQLGSSSLDSHSGYMNILIAGENGGVETYVYEAEKISSFIPDTSDFDLSRSIAIEFRWGGNFKEALAAFYLAQVLMSEFNAKTVDLESGGWIGLENIVKAVSTFEAIPG